jgi:hypothetical protein
MGHDHAPAAAELLAAAATLATLHGGTGEDTHTHGAATAEGETVTKAFTEQLAEPLPATDRPSAGDDQRVRKHVTEKVTKQAARRHAEPAWKPRPIDPDTVRLERSTDYDVTGTWRVFAGPADDPVLVGLLRRRGRGKNWEARTPSLVAVGGGPWRTRQDALVQLVLNRQQAAARRSGKRRPR